MESEKALTALEKSTDDANLLLATAAQIAAVEFDQVTHRYTRPLHISQCQDSSSSSFREQWLLRWLLKRLGEAVSSSPRDGKRDESIRLIENQKVWAFLSYLMRSISTNTLLGILLERQFTGLLISAIEHEYGDRLSGGPPVPEREFVDIKNDETVLLFTIEEIYYLYAQSLQRSDLKLEAQYDSKTRTTDPAWAKSSQQAAELVGCLLIISKRLVCLQTRGVNQQVDLESLVRWLNLWHGMSTASEAKTDKVHQSFCDVCLGPALELMATLNNTQEFVLARQNLTVLEAQIALHVIIPLRSWFSNALANKWKQERFAITWSHVQPLHDQLKKCLHGILKSEVVMGIEFESLNEPGSAATLLSVASRLIPSHDRRRRRWEQPWLEALILSLMHLAYPKHMRRMVLDKSGVLVSSEMPQTTQQLWPDQIFATISKHDIGLDLPAALYLVLSTLIDREHLAPASILEQLLQINALVFVPQQNGPNYQKCLDTLLSSIGQREEVQSDDFVAILEGVLLPLLQVFAGVRELSRFIEMWLPNLRDALFARAESFSRPDVVDTLLVWDDEVLFAKFESMLELNPVQDIGPMILTSTVEDLESMLQVRPTNDILARLTVFISILRVKGNEWSSQSQARDDLRAITTHIVASLRQQTDYLGQRWKLWWMLYNIQTIDPLLVSGDDVQSLVADGTPYLSLGDCEDIDKTPAKQRLPLVAELFHAFQFIIEYEPISSTAQASSRGFAINHMNTILHTHAHSILPGSSSSIHWEQMTWNGKTNSLFSSNNLLCGYFGSLIRAARNHDTLLELVSQVDVQRIAYHASKMSSSFSASNEHLGELSQVLLAMLSHANSKPLFVLYGDLFFEDADYTVPNALHTSPLEDVDRGVAGRYAQLITHRLMKIFSSLENIRSEDVESHLALLTRIVRKYPVSVGMPGAGFPIASLAESLVTLRERSCVTKRFMVGRIISIFGWLRQRIAQMDKIDAADHAVKEILSWSKSTISKLEASIIAPEELSLLDAVLGPWPDAQHIPTSKKLINLKKRYLQILPTSSVLTDDLDLADLLAQNSAGCLADAIRSINLNGPRPENDHERGIEALRKQVYWHAEQDLKLNIPSLSGSTWSSAADSMQQQLKTTDDMMRHCRAGEQAELVRQLCSAPLSSINRLPSLLLARIAMSLAPEDLRHHLFICSVFAQCAGLEGIAIEKSSAEVISRIDLCKVVLTFQSAVVGQSVIDTLLGSLAMITTSNSSSESHDSLATFDGPGDTAAAIFDRLTGVVDVLLSQYRRRLSGRSHLLIQVLRNLLRCFFHTQNAAYVYQNPVLTKQRQAFRSSLPGWLHLSDQEMLPLHSAEKLSRIISSICNPTTASARSAGQSKKKPANSTLGLNDETLKAKRLASQYMQYLLVEYSRCNLDGVISPEVRDKLKPGLYSVLDALDKESMRAMNAAMDPSSQAIFKVLYDDWYQYGRWDQT